MFHLLDLHTLFYSPHLPVSLCVASCCNEIVAVCLRTKEKKYSGLITK